MKLINRLFIASALFIASSCGGPDVKDAKASLTEAVEPKEDQLNISILWDLSDRINPKEHPAHPEHYQRDLEIIRSLTELFKQDMDQRGAYRAKGKIRVIFTPTPADAEINNLAKELDVDLSKFSGEGSSKEKKKVYDSITTKFTKASEKIYQLTMATNSGKKYWDGSDIWRFFKNDVDQCIEDENYRNIVVLITDGYIYHRNSSQATGPRSQAVLASTLMPFRGNPSWRSLFNSNNYGLIAERSDLQNLEVLVLEIQPEKGQQDDENYIEAYLRKWFTEMGVKDDKIKIYGSGIPNDTKKRIERFIKSKS